MIDEWMTHREILNLEHARINGITTTHICHWKRAGKVRVKPFENHKLLYLSSDIFALIDDHARRTKELERAADRAKVENRFVDNALNAMIRTGQKFDSERIKNELAICEER